MKIKSLLILCLSLFWACNTLESTSGSHQTENVLAEIQLTGDFPITQISAKVIPGDVSPFDTNTHEPIDITLTDSTISFEKPQGRYWIEIIHNENPKQVFWSTINSEDTLASILKLEPSAHMNAYYPASGLDIVAIGIGGSDRVTQIDEFGRFRIENLPPGTHQCFGKAIVTTEDNTIVDSLIYLGDFKLVPGENIIDESKLF